MTACFVAMEERPAAYRKMMDRLKWFYDLSRRPGGDRRVDAPLELK